VRELRIFIVVTSLSTENEGSTVTGPRQFKVTVGPRGSNVDKMADLARAWSEWSGVETWLPTSVYLAG